MPQVDCLSPIFKFSEPEKPNFGLVKVIPHGFSTQIEEAVKDFMATSHVPHETNMEGFYNQTIQTIASCGILGGQGDLWLGMNGQELWTYILAYIAPNVDNRLTYHVNQAWVRKDQRCKPWVKEAWQMVRGRAKEAFCSHLIVFSSRGNDDAYCRFLGKGFKPYLSMLKEDF